MSARRPTSLAAHEAALQMLYALDLGGQDAGQIERWYVQAHPLEPATQARAVALLGAVVAQQARIEELLERHAIGWRLERMSAVDRNLLKLATAELLATPAPPSAAVVRAAVKLARKFSQPQAVSFVQGVMEAIARSLASPPEVAHHAQ